MSGDPYWGAVSLLLHGDGANGATTISDSSLYPKTVTANGNARISTAQSKFGGASIYLDGNGDYLTLPDDSAFSFGSGDFTIEYGLYPAVSGTAMFLYNQRVATGFDTPLALNIDAANKLRLTMSTDAASWAVDVTSTATISAGAWHHLALVRRVTTYYLFLDGSQILTGAISGSLYDSASPITIGAVGNGTYGFNGYLDDVRITRGVARYTANFTPPDAPFPHAPDWWGTVRHGERASARPVTSPRKFTVPRAIPRSRTRADNSAGLGSIVGTVKVDTLSVSRKVRLFDVASGRLLKETWSDKAGVYRFDGLALDRPYTVLSHDHQRDYNATVADYVYAEVLP